LRGNDKETEKEKEWIPAFAGMTREKKMLDRITGLTGFFLTTHPAFILLSYQKKKKYEQD